MFVYVLGKIKETPEASIIESSISYTQFENRDRIDCFLSENDVLAKLKFPRVDGRLETLGVFLVDQDQVVVEESAFRGRYHIIDGIPASAIIGAAPLNVAKEPISQHMNNPPINFSNELKDLVVYSATGIAYAETIENPNYKVKEFHRAGRIKQRIAAPF